MPRKEADKQTAETIRRLLEAPEAVETTSRAYYDMMADSLELADVCDAARDWIDAGEFVEEIVTKQAAGFVGCPAYVVKPSICGSTYYLKFGIREKDTRLERLLVISAHKEGA